MSRIIAVQGLEAKVFLTIFRGFFIGNPRLCSGLELKTDNVEVHQARPTMPGLTRGLLNTMAKLHQIYQRLQTTQDSCVDLAMAQAMPTADPVTLKLIALILLQRQQIDGLMSLVENYHRLPDQVKQTILERTVELTRALRMAIGNHKSQGPANAVQIIHESGSTRLAYLIADQLRYGQDGLKDESARCLLELAQRTSPGRGLTDGSVADPIEIAFVRSTVEEAVRFYAHHKRQDVLLAVFSLPLNAVTALMAEVHKLASPITDHTAMLLTRADTPAVRRSLLPALAAQGLTQPALDGLRMAAESKAIGQALVNWHLLLLRRYRIALKKIKTPEGFRPDPSFHQSANTHESRGLACWLESLPVDRPALVRQLGALHQAKDHATRLLALRRLLTLAQDAAPDAKVHAAIAGYCADPRQSIVRVALVHLIRIDYPGIAKVLAQLVNSRHPDIQRIAARRLAPVAFARLWDSWPKLNRAQQLAAGRALIKIDPTFHATLADKLAVPDKPTKLRALSLVNQLNQGLLLQDILLRLTQDRDPYVVSAAVKALGSAEPDRAAPVIESALEHEDERVRANAIEALAQLNSSRHIDQLAEMTGEQEDNRARANAIQALMQMRTADALSALSRMLADPRPQHRASALWLVETMGVAEVAREVAEMSISETDQQIKARAGRVIHEIIDQMSHPLPASLLNSEDLDDSAPPAHSRAAAG